MPFLVDDFIEEVRDDVSNIEQITQFENENIAGPNGVRQESEAESNNGSDTPERGTDVAGTVPEAEGRGARQKFDPYWKKDYYCKSTRLIDPTVVAYSSQSTSTKRVLHTSPKDEWKPTVPKKLNETVESKDFRARFYFRETMRPKKNRTKKKVKRRQKKVDLRPPVSFKDVQHYRLPDYMLAFFISFRVNNRLIMGLCPFVYAFVNQSETTSLSPPPSAGCVSTGTMREGWAGGDASNNNDVPKPRFTPKWPESNIGAKVVVGTRIIYREHTNSPRVRLGRREANSRGKWTHHRVAVDVSCQKKGEDNAYILTLIKLLHRLISGIKHVDQRDRVLSPLLLYSSTNNMSIDDIPIDL
ncbi:hypothetical protein KSS87_019317 [Heliosperma pusillum]|nr:hypothetical protein KSS87_019317 [Heliosperma pusillum]